MADVWPWVLTPWTLGILGLLIGSFLNVVIHRKPILLERQWLGDAAGYLQDGAAMQRVLGAGSPRLSQLVELGKALQSDVEALPRLSLSVPRSRCPKCGRPITWYENIPVLSWLRLKGRCAGCQNPISARYPLVELFTGLLFAAIAWRFGPTETTLVYCGAAALLVAAALIDFDTTLLPDDLTLPLLGLGLIAAWRGWTPLSLSDAALGALFGYLSLWSVAWLYKLVRKVEGMAEGDFRLLAALGALLGWKALIPIILLSSGVGAVVGVFLIVFRKHGRDVPIPFGPYLAGGGLAAMFWGAALSRLWLRV
jgi:leader peptidase (prepilin peptidase)/N-methyltransferase